MKAGVLLLIPLAAFPQVPPFSSMEDDDLRDLIAFLRQLSGGAPRLAVKLGDAAQGRLVYDRSGCVGCHRIGQIGSVYGPDLSRIGSGRSVEYRETGKFLIKN